MMQPQLTPKHLDKKLAFVIILVVRIFLKFVPECKICVSICLLIFRLSRRSRLGNRYFMFITFMSQLLSSYLAWIITRAMVTRSHPALNKSMLSHLKQ